MPKSRTEKLLVDWRVAADAVRLPQTAPTGRRPGYQIGVGSAVALSLMLVLVVVVTRGGSLPGPGSSGAVALASPTLEVSAAAPSTAVPFMSAPASTPAPATAAPIHLPSAGGTCTAKQLVLGVPESAASNSSIGFRAVNVLQPIRNDGEQCLLKLPTTIAVSPASGEFALRPVGPAENQTSFRIGAGESRLIILHAWWWVGSPSTGGDTPPPPPSCSQPIIDVTRVLFPFASGSAEIDFVSPWHEVCLMPTRVTVTVR
jgi:hypothetical protein